MGGKVKDYREFLIKKLKDDPSRAVGYLNAAMEENEGAFLIALKDVVDALGGVSKIAKELDLHRVSIHHILSEKGNPSLKSLDAILDKVGLRLVVEERPQENI